MAKSESVLIHKKYPPTARLYDRQAQLWLSLRQYLRQHRQLSQRRQKHVPTRQEGGLLAYYFPFILDKKKARDD
jgi:hypothetical protein